MEKTLAMDIESLRQDFPILNKNIAYLDSACMSLKPRSVVDAMSRYFLEYPGCGERSSHRIGRQVTEEFEAARRRIARFIHCREDELIFTKNTTEGLNLAAHTLPLQPSDTVLVTDKEHNSNFLPWGQFNRVTLPTQDGRWDAACFETALAHQPRAIAIQQTSNLDGRTMPIADIAQRAHSIDAYCIVDGAQSVPHQEIDVHKLGVDMFSFSGHKMLGPSIGCLYIKKELSDDLRPFLVGGGTVLDVRNGNPHYLKAPQGFEAGLQDYAGAIGLAAAVAYLERIGMQKIARHEHDLTARIADGIASIKNVAVLGGSAAERGGITSCTIPGVDSREAAIMLDSHGVLVRGGFHCCHTWFNARKIAGSIRASLYFYNTEADADAFVAALSAVAKMG